MVKIRSICLLFVVCLTGNVSAQNYNYGYLVEFTDKNNSTYSIFRANEFLSDRAISRRTKNKIEITNQDFPVNKTYIDSLLQFNATLHVTSRWFNSAVFYTQNNNFITHAKTCSFVKEITLVYQGNLYKSSNIENNWNTNAGGEQYGGSYNQIAMCNAQILHERGYRGKGIHIAVLDVGFWHANEFAGFDSLFQNHRILSTWDFVSHNSNVFNDGAHGMNVLSILGGNLPGEIIGTAPEASYHLYRSENESNEYPIEEENWIAAAEVADSAGADIITSSLGYNLYIDNSMSYTYSDMDGKTARVTKGAEAAFSKGILVINSAGNEAKINWHYIIAPADGENVLCVGAVNSLGIITDFSSRGPSFDGRVKPDVVAQGGSTTIIQSDGTVGTGNGTSFSCPVIAGMAACLWQALPGYSNKQLLGLIRSYGDRFSNPDSIYGYGIPDFGKSTFLIDSFIYSNTSTDDLMKIYPNPFNGTLFFYLYINKGQAVEVALYDARGVKVYTEKMPVISGSYNNLKLENLYGLESGYYILTVITAEAVISETVVKF